VQTKGEKWVHKEPLTEPQNSEVPIALPQDTVVCATLIGPYDLVHPSGSSFQGVAKC
jgi:hypothetical protein